MNDLLKLALEYPAKIERVFLWVLQALITAWFVSEFFGLKLDMCFLTEGNLHLREECIKSISLIKTINVLVVFTVTWIIVWEILADLSIKILFKLLGSTVSYLFRFFVFVIFIFPIRVIVKLIAKIWKSDKTTSLLRNSISEDLESDYIKREKEFKVLLKPFYWLNKITKSSIGSASLLTILLSYEKINFIQSRVIRYFTIITILVYINFLISDPIDLNWLKLSILILTLILGIVIIEINEVFSNINSAQIHYLTPQLEFDIYRDFVYQTFNDSILMQKYDIEKNRKFIKLKIKDKSIFPGHAAEVIIFPFDKRFIDFKTFLSQKKLPDSSQLILVSSEVPSLWERNIIVEYGVYYIYAKIEAELLDGIKSIYPLISGESELTYSKS